MAGWFGPEEIHVLSPVVLRRRAGGAGSLEALFMVPQRAYTLLVVGVNNPSLPPPFRPGAVRRLIGYPWLAEGASQYYSGQLAYLRPAIARRLREGPVPFPPGPRDAHLLAGALFDLLSRERGDGACMALACSGDAGDARGSLESAFGSSLRDVAYRWRGHLDRLASGRAQHRPHDQGDNG
jgi:hypothetical protein